MATLAPWRSPLARALHLNRSLVYARYVQLATVRPDGRPANRTIVFRGFLEDSNQLKFVTDSRSDKAEQISNCPYGEACWYFPKSREQFRLMGQLTLVSADQPDPGLQQARLTQWQELSDSARLQFAWPNPAEPRSPITAFTPDPPDPESTFPNFCLLLLDPEQVDHLELRGDPQNRHLYISDPQAIWTVKAINP